MYLSLSSELRLNSGSVDDRQSSESEKYVSTFKLKLKYRYQNRWSIPRTPGVALNAMRYP